MHLRRALYILFLPLLLSACASAPTLAVEPAAPSLAALPPSETPIPAAGKELILATTTSTQDSGLLEYLLPAFEQQYGVRVNVIAVGTGQALKLGEDGNADVLLVHAPAREEVFMAAGHGVRREEVMYNDFVIVGPQADPAGIRGEASAAAAFQKIAAAGQADSGTIFISRGDESGTHAKELMVWEAAGVEPTGIWYVSAGQGMGEVLTMAEEQQAYTLSDRATFLARTLQGTELQILGEGDPALFNPYGVIAVDPAKNPRIQPELADKFIDWLVSMPTQERIASFGVEQFSQALFTPNSAAWNAR